MLNGYFSFLLTFGEEFTENGRMLDLNLAKLENIRWFHPNVPLEMLGKVCYTFPGVRNDQLENFTGIFPIL